MDVVIDTNALRGAGLDSPAVKALAEYLRRTRSKLIIPAVVREELLAQRREGILKAVRSLESAAQDLAKLVPGHQVTTSPVDESVQLSAFDKQLQGLADRVEFIENKPEDLPELVRRLTGRLPPASPGGEEARDVLIWFVVKRLVQAGKVALITGDKTFYHGDKLNPKLVAELPQREASIETARSIDDFLKQHHARSSFIDSKWVEKCIDDSNFFSALSAFLDEAHTVFLRDIEKLGEPTGYFSLIQIVQHEIEEFFVSDVQADELYVSAIIWAELEVESEYYESAYGEYVYRRGGVPAARPVLIHPCVQIHVQIAVKSGNPTMIVINEIERV